MVADDDLPHLGHGEQGDGAAGVVGVELDEGELGGDGVEVDGWPGAGGAAGRGAAAGGGDAVVGEEGEPGGLGEVGAQAGDDDGGRAGDAGVVDAFQGDAGEPVGVGPAVVDGLLAQALQLGGVQGSLQRQGQHA